MNKLPLLTDTSRQTADEDKALVISGKPSVIDSCSLVLSAKDIWHRLDYREDGSIALYVIPEEAAAARFQLQAFFTENQNWPPPQVVPEPGRFPALLPTLIVIGGLAVFFQITGPWHHESIWFAAGVNDADLVLKDRDYFRLITSLMLHADLAHLIGNCLIGGFLLYFFLQINGPGLGLLALIASGSGGNLLNDLLHTTNHRSVGFSTAVFAIIGMLSMYRIAEQKRPFGIRLFTPFMAGAALLALIGSTGVQTDLGAHLFGLGTGLIVGLLLALQPVKALRSSSFFQLFSLALSVFLLILAWNRGLARLAL